MRVVSDLVAPVPLELARFRPTGPIETADVGRLTALVTAAENPWDRSLPLHLTASALVVDPAAGRVLLRWHGRVGAWLQVGGHADPGETDSTAVALREAVEETGLTDLAPFGTGFVQVAVVPVPAGKGEAAHEHGDLRYVLLTGQPEAATSENDRAPLCWLGWEDALALAADSPNLTVLIERARARLS